MFDRSLVTRAAETRDRTAALVIESQSLCRASEQLIISSKDIIGDMDDFLSHFTEQTAEA